MNAQTLASITFLFSAGKKIHFDLISFSVQFEYPLWNLSWKPMMVQIYQKWQPRVECLFT